MQAASELYRFSAEVLAWCHAHNVLFSCENPRSSWMWALEPFKDLLELEGVEDTDYQGCMHGHDRPKWPRWRPQRPSPARPGAAVLWRP